jgi:hypothetical protein
MSSAPAAMSISAVVTAVRAEITVTLSRRPPYGGSHNVESRATVQDARFEMQVR